MRALPNKHYSEVMRGHTGSRQPKDTWWKRYGGRTVDSRFQVQLEKDGGDSSWMETGSLRVSSTGSNVVVRSHSWSARQRHHRLQSVV